MQPLRNDKPSYPRIYTHPSTPKTISPPSAPASPSSASSAPVAQKYEELLRLIDWPEPPTPVTHYHFSTSPKTCDYHLLKARDTYRVGETLEVLITARDHKDRPKEYGGDYFRAKLHSPTLKAAVAGQVKDHGNGSYLATFFLPWPGIAEVQIRLIHSSEAVDILKKKREQYPEKIYFYGYFQANGSSEKTECNLELIGKDVCKYRDPVSGDTWQCVRPRKLPCDSRIYHSSGGRRKVTNQLEDSLLSGGVTDRIILGDVPRINVSAGNRGFGLASNLSACRPSQESAQPSGYYYKDRWTSLTCLSQHFPNPSDALSCLKGKDVYMLGDSTLRQWFDYLDGLIPSLKRIDLHVSNRSGPLLMVDADAGLAIRWRFHGLPLRTAKSMIANLHYDSAEIVGIGGGPDTIVVINLWAHFTTYPVRVYLERVERIRQAVASLLFRSPKTTVLIKSANTGPKSVYDSDWLSLQLDLLLRAAFKGLDVTILDVWEMTSCHYLPDIVHPMPPILRDGVDLMLSYICPQ